VLGELGERALPPPRASFLAVVFLPLLVILREVFQPIRLCAKI
jgi:hypothetical protein